HGLGAGRKSARPAVCRAIQAGGPIRKHVRDRMPRPDGNFVSARALILLVERSDGSREVTSNEHTAATPQVEPWIRVDGPRKAAVDRAKGRAKRSGRETQLLAKSGISRQGRPQRRPVRQSG